MKKILVLIFVITLSFQVNAEIKFHGFAEYGLGSRIVQNTMKKDDVLLNEARLQLEFKKYSDIATLNFKTDFYKDSFTDETEIHIREANITLYPSYDWELKIGRQILTWGTGDLVFVNDLFPKDWKSFFIGRDDEYLKAPVNAVKFSLFQDLGDFNFVIVPVFTPDEYITGERLSYWGNSGLTGNDFVDIKPDKNFENSEYYFRWNKTVNAVEYALYSYKGFFKRPLGMNSSGTAGIFPKLAVHGFSVRAQLFGGIANIESGYYDSINDRDGKNPLLENSFIKTVVGYDKEIVKDFTAGLQYFSEWMQDYNEYKQSMINSSMPVLKEENHDWITLRLTLNTKKQTLIYSVFTYYSPAEEDFYTRPKFTYKMSDEIIISGGFNIFGGKNNYTFFGQLEDNNNAYLRVRYNF